MICSRNTACSLLAALLLLAAALALAPSARAGIGDVDSAAGDDDGTPTGTPTPGAAPPAGTPPGTTTTGTSTSPAPGSGAPGAAGTTATGGAGGTGSTGTTAPGTAAPGTAAPGATTTTTTAPTTAPTTTMTTTTAVPGTTVSPAAVAAPAVAPMAVSIAAVAAAANGDGPGGRCGGDTPAARRPAPKPANAASPAAIKALGETETAIRVAGEARALLRAEPALLPPAIYCDAAADLADRGEYRAAIQAAGMALLLGQSAGDRRLLAYAARNLAYAYSLAGALDQATHWTREALRHAAGLKDERAGETIVAPVLKIQGDIALRRGRAAEAARLYGQALARIGNGDTRPWLKLALVHAELAQGQVARADALIGEARRDAPEALKPALARTEGEAALVAKDAPRAARLFQAASDQAGADPYMRMWAAYGLARARRAANQADAALAAFAQAIDAAEQVRERFRSEEFKSGFFATAQDIFDAAIATAADAARSEIALDFSERSRSRALLDLLIGRVQDQAQGGPNQSPAGALTFIDRIAPAQPLPVLRGDVPPGTAIVVYHVLERRTLAWVLRPGELRQVSLPLDRVALVAAIERFVGGIVAEAGGIEQSATAMYDMLVAPLGLRADESLLVVTHDVLHRVPFAALRDGKSWLIERRAVATLPSLNALHALLASPGPAPSGALVLGNPDLGDQADALPAAEREAAQVAALLPDARIYLREAATRARLIEEAPGRRFVHIAAHSAIDPLDPLASPLYLAGRPKPAGAMTARDFYALDLRAARLIALSACQTGLGTIGRGNEIWGFQRTVLAAGARSLLVSLWGVEDEATAQLMTGFYKRLPGQPMMQALRQSQVELIRAGRGHPLYWAAFTLVGDWR